MEGLVVVCQIVVGLVVLSVWTIRYNHATAWRGGDAQSMSEEFEIYGLSERRLRVTRATKISLAALILAGIWVPQIVVPAALGMAGLMLIAVAMHIKVGDAWYKSVPALTMFVLCTIIAYIYGVPDSALQFASTGLV